MRRPFDHARAGGRLRPDRPRRCCGAGRRAGPQRWLAAQRQPLEPAGSRTWPLTLSPAPDDLALAEVSFARPRSRTPAEGLAAGRRERPVRRGLPCGGHPALRDRRRRAGARAARQPALAVARSRLRAACASLPQRSLGAPTVRTLADPFARTSTGRHRPRCATCRVHGSPLAGSELRVLSSRGAALSGFDAAGAVAEAYDAPAACPTRPRSGRLSSSPLPRRPRRPSPRGPRLQPRRRPVLAPRPRHHRSRAANSAGRKSCVPRPGYAVRPG